MREKSSGILHKRRKSWGKRLTMLMLSILIVSGQWIVGPSPVQAAGESLGATYFTDEDNWGGGDGSSTEDGDLDVGIKNQNKVTADNYTKYPVEFKIVGVDKLPTKSAQLLIRALDVDEYIQAVNGNGEWDRVYFSSNPADIKFGTPYTTWLTTPSAWVTNIASSGIAPNGLGYKNEITEGALLGTLSGKDSKWSTSVLTFDQGEWDRIALGDNYVGVTIHHYYQDTRAGTSLANTNWQMTVDWGQLVIDGGVRSNAEITEAGLKVEPGKVTIDTSFIPKETGNFSMEINVIERTVVNGEVVERSIGLNKKLFSNSAEGTNYDWNIEFVNDVNNAISIDPNKEYAVNIMLFDDRGNGVAVENYTNPGFAQHVVTFSTHDPIVADITKSGLRSAPTNFTADDFKDKYLKVNGNAPNGDKLESVKITTLPDVAKGVLKLDGVPVTKDQLIPVGHLDKLAFVPVDDGFDGTVDFLWNGYNGERYAPDDATVTINSSPEVQDFSVFMKIGELNFPFSDINNFIPHYVDPGKEDLVKVKIVTLPDPLKGKLVLDVAGVEIDIVENQEINVVDLNHLKFVPFPGVTGAVTFDWNGSDGLQYALVDKTVTLTINIPPVVEDVMRTGIVGATISFTTNNFALDPAYVDTDLDALTHVRIALPADFADSGKLGYTSGSDKVYIVPGDTATLTATELNSLQFEPSVSLEGSTVTFSWYGSDGMHFSDNPANVIITYKKLPIAEPLVYNEEEGVSSIPIVLKGTGNASVTEVTYESIITDPLKGILIQDLTDPSGLTWTYTPNSDFQLGTDSFTYTVKDKDGDISSPVEITIHIHKALDGWVGNKTQGDATIVKAIPDQPLKLSAISSQSANEVTATVDGLEVPLTLMNSSTWATDGYKQWENTTFILPSNTATGQYTVAYVAFNGAGDVLQIESASKLIDNSFKVVGANLSLTADPEKIIGDGHSTTELTALLLDENGAPIEGVEVIFTAPVATGQFVGSDRAVTDAQGKAKVTYQSAQITGVSEQNITLLATVNDTTLGLNAKDDVIITFMPAAIKGFITNGNSNTPVAGASVRVTLDLDGDGVITPGVDFDETVITKADGSYYVIVPKGEVKYELEVTQTVNIGGIATPVTYTQTAKVERVTGAGEENFNSEETVTGIVLFKQPNGQSALLSHDLLNKASIYLKKSDGSYVSSNGVPTAFPLDNQGVFHADGLSIGEYELELRYEIEPGKQITFSRSIVSVTASGEMNITEELVDPYGTITDAVTHQPIEGSKVVLHYANTARNIAKGLTPGAEVTLPALVGFDPNNNASPDQLSDIHGFYAYMVYPETDYYIVVTKTGYHSYTSPTLSVEWDIVRHDAALSPIQTGVPSSSNQTQGPSSTTQSSISLNLSLDKNKVKEGENSQITVTYKNESTDSISSGEIKVTLPAGVEIVDPADGTVTDNTIVWKVANLPGGQVGQFKLVVKWPLLDGAEKIHDIPGVFAANSAKANSSVKVNVFSDRFGELKHYRYILGYPDKEFKLNKSMTRAEVAAIVARLTENVDSDYLLPYKDIRSGHWATNYIRIATKHGYFSGSKDGLFRPDEPITRGELAAVMARFLELEVSKSSEAHFSDTSGHWAEDIIQSLYNSKFLTGYTDGTFKPNHNIIRVEAVTMINRMLYRGPLQGLAPLFPDVPESHWGFGDVQESTLSHDSVRNLDGSETWIRTLSDDMK